MQHKIKHTHLHRLNSLYPSLNSLFHFHIEVPVVLCRKCLYTYKVEFQLDIGPFSGKVAVGLDKYMYSFNKTMGLF